MNKILRYTFGGISAQYYFRQLFFISLLLAFAALGAVLSGLRGADIFNNITPLHFIVAAIVIVNTLLYPYSRFVYESIIGFFFGGNTFYLGGVLLIFALIMKLFFMIVCWGYAVFIAPFGLAYLYYRHSRTAS